MTTIISPVCWSVKEKLYKHLRQCRQACVRLRYLLVINLLNGRGPYETADVLGVHNTTVYRVAKRFGERGEWGLWDGREDNGDTKLDERYLAALYELVRSTPQAHGWRRPTWTRELLVETMAFKTGVRIHVATMSRALAIIHARRGRPRPVVRCPWSKWAKTRRLNDMARLVSSLPARAVALYADEVDISLNPKIGLDWMVRGQQKLVVTPGQNEKRYLAGAMDARSRRLLWVEGERKNSGLFIALLDMLAKAYPRATKIHVIVDNFRMHSSQLVQWALRGHGGRIQLHFLPPYCPEANKIERVWKDLHDAVTRNHRCRTMTALMLDVEEYLTRRNWQRLPRPHTMAA